ncbi:MAG: carbamoyltransferase HypF [Candidatus Brocadia sp.]|nr:carbamoyltransferase HypF [Candidatus Brocadia sp.]
MLERIQISVRGLVQGVGFRPFIYNLATKFSLAGFVQNDTNGVFIDVEGRNESIKEFLDHLMKSPPPHVIIEDIRYRSFPPKGYKEFVIEESAIKEGDTTIVSADISICQDCFNEMHDPTERRYRYPFINCTNCGPRFTIIKNTPYDRANTTMSSFTMCPDCRKEYYDPQNRRFHAQPNACPVCGPQLTLYSSKGLKVHTLDPLSTVCTLLKEGKIVAVKGIGGYHLVCDAMNSMAVSLLRKRKNRNDKPFAVMMENIGTIRQFCHMNGKEETLLLSAQKPIVLLRKTGRCALSPEVAPEHKYLGVMLPYTPLHYLLLNESGLPLVMTSGNMRDEPIVYNDSSAFARLKGIADYFLMHDREIFIRCDDSVVRVNEDKETIIRRSRGYAPFPLRLQYTITRPILACGAFLKNTFCLAHGNHAFISHHIGDLENTESLHSYELSIEHYKDLFSIEPEIIAYDLHPEYLSTKYALTQSDNILKIGIQHHHAHIVSGMAENGISHKVIGVAFDGLGYGDDGNLWGGEFLIADLSGYERVGYLDYVPMPGGEQAIKEPWRMALSYLYQIYGDAISQSSLLPPLQFAAQAKKNLAILFKMLSHRINSPLTSSMGRLFDSVASILGLQHSVNYEGQAAIKLELIADEYETGSYPFYIDVIEGARFSMPLHIVQWWQIIEHIVNDLKSKTANSVISAKFHNTIVNTALQVCTILRGCLGLNDVVLSGGVFQNNFLSSRLIRELCSNGFKVYFHQKIPCNDGGISLGQAVIASERCKTCA